MTTDIVVLIHKHFELSNSSYYHLCTRIHIKAFMQVFELMLFKLQDNMGYIKSTKLQLVTQKKCITSELKLTCVIHTSKSP